MKSIVLCERTLVQDSEGFSNLKEDRINEHGDEKEEEEKILNGVGGSIESKTETMNFEKDGEPFHNGDKSYSESSVNEEVTKQDGSENETSADLLTSEVDGLVAIEGNSLCSDRDESDCNLRENLSSESIILENLGEQSNSVDVQSRSFQSEMNGSVENGERDDDAIQILGSEESANSSQELRNEPSGKSYNIISNEENEMKISESKESMHPLEDLTLDLDENKENEKEEKTDDLVDFSGDDLLNKDSSECEIQVREVQTMSGLEKDAMWADNDLKKCNEDIKVKLEEKLIEDCQEVATPTEGSMSAVVDEKEDDCQELIGNETDILEAQENIEEGMHIEVEESEHAEELKMEEKESEVIDSDNFSSSKTITCSRTEHEVRLGRRLGRKRHLCENREDDSLGKKKRIADDGVEAELVQSEEEGSSRCEGLSSLEKTASKVTDVADQTTSETKVSKTRRGSIDVKNARKLKPCEAKEDKEIKKHQRTECMLSVLENFRGTLKTLTRSDLEELIVQKLCEVITERSNVGELRRKAQALEQDQERWKAKAQSLTKQMREMEMVMKKYMAEVQKQIKEGDTHVVTPLKVSRSVGLQVSFYSSANKGLKATVPQSVPSSQAQNVNARNVKCSPTKMPLQYSPVTQNMRNKPAPSFQKVSQPLQKPPVSQQRRSTIPSTEYGSTPTNRPVVQQSLLNRGTQSQIQVQRPNYKQAAGMTPQQSYNQQQQQNGSKVIDLTEDDDRQTGNTAKSKPIRVVNNLNQSAVTQNNRFTYLLPTTSASTASSVGQSRQVLIATPSVPQSNRQIMCSMPPLLFKGGNVVQSGSQSQMLNQLNKVILPKPARHPAPLPQPPVFKKSTRPCLKLLPPRPALKVSKVQTGEYFYMKGLSGIVLSWNMALSPEHAPIVSYQLYAYQESDSPPATTLWKKVGDVKALPLPMACTLTQFMSGHKYHFAVRAVDLHSRIGPFSFPGTIVLV